MSRQVLARMTRFHVRTSADRLETVCLSGKNGSHRRTGRMRRLTRMCPAVRRKRVSSIWHQRSCINVSGLRLELVVLRIIMDISACDLITGQASKVSFRLCH
jgi:hypothetical protein